MNIPQEAIEFTARFIEWATSNSEGRNHGIRARMEAFLFTTAPHVRSNRTAKEMGEMLGITAHGFRKHVRSFEQTFGVRSRKQRAVSRGLKTKDHSYGKST